MTGVFLVAMPAGSAVFAAASARLASLVSALLVAYLAFVTATAGAALALSPFREVNQGALATFEAALLLVTAAFWWWRGRPGLPLAAARAAVREVAGSPETAIFFVLIVVLLAYELLLALAVPPNNWDSLTYHLVRAAAWLQHGGVFWIPNAPTDRINEFQPLAEQELLYLFAATGSSALFAVPQYLAELAILIAIYGSARRLGFAARPSASASFLFATFSLIALESSTAQNDLVAASFSAVAACLLLGGGGLEAALAGVAIGYGLGAKLSTALVLPILLALTLMRGRRTLPLTVAGGLAGLAALGIWGFVLNDIHTGQLLGHGGGRVENTASASWPRSAVTALFVLYQAMDISRMSHRLIDVLAVAGLVGALAALVYAFRRGRGAKAGARDASDIALPLLIPLLVIGLAAFLALIGGWWGHPIRGPAGSIGGMVRTAGEDISAFGPLGSVLLVALPVLGIIAFVRRRADGRLLVLAFSVPCFITLLVLQAKFNPFLTRFVVVPVVLAAPVMALLFRSRAATIALAVVASIAVGVTIVNDQNKPLRSHPWRFDEAQAVIEDQEPAAAGAARAYDRLVPPHACTGAVLGVDEPAYLLYGPRFQHRVTFLPVADAVHQAVLDGLFYVVITKGTNRWAAGSFRQAGWRIRPLGRYWLLASEPHATTGAC